MDSEKKGQLEVITTAAVSVVAYSLVVAIVYRVITWEGYQIGTAATYSEESLVEVVQSLFLLITVALFIVAALLSTSWRSPAVFFAAIALIALIREQDFFFDDRLFDGAWQTSASLVLVALVIYLIRYPRSFSKELAAYVKLRSAGILLSGFLVVGVFSRLIGLRGFWLNIVGDDEFMVVYRIIEEGTELLGYSLLVLAALEAALLAYSTNKAALRVSTGNSDGAR